MASQDRQLSFQNRKNVGYFCHLRIEDRHIGAILVTNQIGVPLEFKYTEPVTTTKLHKILYGSVLDRYIHETVIRDRLAHEIRSEPDFFIIPYIDKEFLGQIAGKDVMAIQRVGTGAGETSGPFTRVRDREAIIQLEEGPALRIAFSSMDDAIQHNLTTLLQELSRTMDILEPLERVATALKTLCADEKRV
jgi:hypothetical protein